MISAATIYTLLLLGVAGLTGVASARESNEPVVSKDEGKMGQVKNHWALLVAGSRYFWNYRHQSDVCHAYQLLKAQGFDDDHVITMVFDDIAYNFWQAPAYAGQIFNRPGGPDVYEGCAKDYTGYDVTPHNMYNVLKGNKTAMEGIGSGRVIESTGADDIFIFYSDHGSVGIIGMPSGGYVFAHELHKVLKEMSLAKKFNQLVFYLESCESGSMFEGILEDDLRIYAVSASNASESSWATYCSDISGLQSPQPSEIGTCLGDLFSTNWMEDTEFHDISAESLLQQFRSIHKWTGALANGGYGSEVLQYGSLGFEEESVAVFLSDPDKEEEVAPEPQTEDAEETFTGPQLIASLNLDPQDPLVQFAHMLPGQQRHVDQRDADMVFFMQRAVRTNSMDERNKMLNELRRTMMERRQADMDLRTVISGLIQIIGFDKHPLPNNIGAATEMIVNDPMGRPGSGKPATDDFDCLAGMLMHFEEVCGQVTDYTMRFTRAFANLCNLGVTTDDFLGSVMNVCGDRGSSRKHPVHFHKAPRAAVVM